MKILYVTSEAAPYAASGGLGDVMGALPREIANGGAEVSVILPLYGSMKESFRREMKKYADISFNLAWRKTGASVFLIENSGVKYYFLENHYYFSRQKLYGEPDDGERFAFFCRAVVEFMLQTGNIPDILHANDWQAAMSVVYIKTEYSPIRELQKIRTVYTIHNIEYQGKFPTYILGDVFGLDAKYFDVVEYDGCINLMKGALVVSDYITTVSPNYATELRYDYFAFGLAGIINSVSGKMTGVINGIDYSYFSPEHGGDIDFPYGKNNLIDGKRQNKLALQRELGLPQNDDIPLIVMITRLAGAKGIDLVLRVLDELLFSTEVQFVILGTGEAEYENALRTIESNHPTKMRALIKFDRVTSKKMYAAADLFLMPSKSEPCGLSQMICCSYGTLPVVHGVGGLADSIKNYGEDGANGFVFADYNAHEMLFLIKRALDLYKDKSEWKKLVETAYASDFSWQKSAGKYMEIYENLINW